MDSEDRHSLQPNSEGYQQLPLGQGCADLAPKIRAVLPTNNQPRATGYQPNARLPEAINAKRLCMMKLRHRQRSYQPISVIAEFPNEDGSDSSNETIEANYECIKQETLRLIASRTESVLRMILISTT